MDHPLIHDRGRGPELVGTRTTIYNLVGEFLNPDLTEAEIARWNDLAPEQVAAMRAYFLRHYGEVMAQHERIEERIRMGIGAQHDSPEFQAQVAETRANFKLFQEWVADREASGLPSPREMGDWAAAFREWKARKAIAARIV